MKLICFFNDLSGNKAMIDVSSYFSKSDNVFGEYSLILKGYDNQSVVMDFVSKDKMISIVEELQRSILQYPDKTTILYATQVDSEKFNGWILNTSGSRWHFD